jgi:citronellyl-CoA dehydrogenase
MWITNGTQADWMCMLVNTSEGGSPYHNKSLVIVPLKTPGVHIERKLDKMGMRSSDTALIFFDDVRVPKRNLIGDREGLGFAQQMAQFQDERLWGAANTTAVLEEALKITGEYLSERRAFGSPLISQQFIHFKLAELSTELQSLRSLTYRAVGLHVARGPTDPEVIRLASMAKFKSGRLSRETLDWCVQFHGGMGYMLETRVNRMYRDLRVLAIGGGADEVMLGVIAKLEGFVPKRSRGDS